MLDLVGQWLGKAPEIQGIATEIARDAASAEDRGLAV